MRREEVEGIGWIGMKRKEGEGNKEEGVSVKKEDNDDKTGRGRKGE